MKILLEIPDNRASSLLEVLNNISYVKTKPLTEIKAELMSDIREAVEEIKIIKKGIKKPRLVEDFLDEL